MNRALFNLVERIVERHLARQNGAALDNLARGLRELAAAVQAHAGAIRARSLCELDPLAFEKQAQRRADTARGFLGITGDPERIEISSPTGQTAQLVGDSDDWAVYAGEERLADGLDSESALRIASAHLITG